MAARREVLEETGVEATVDRLAWVQVLPTVTHVNGDVSTYLDHTFACTYVGGDAHVGDDESVEVGWRPRRRPAADAALVPRPDRVRAPGRPGHPVHVLNPRTILAGWPTPHPQATASTASPSPRSTSTTTSRWTTRSRSGPRTSRSTTSAVKAPMTALVDRARAGVRAGQDLPALPRRAVRQGQDAVQDPPGRVRRRRPVHRLVRPGRRRGRPGRRRVLRRELGAAVGHPRGDRRRQARPTTAADPVDTCRSRAGSSAARRSRPRRAGTTRTTRASTCCATSR